VLPEAVTRELTDVLVAAVSDGTATRASLATFEVAGKTGTARRTGTGGQYDSGSYTASFVGYFPAREPQLVIYVKLDQPQGEIYGGRTAAPVTRETLHGILAAHARVFDGRSLLTARQGGAEPIPAPTRGRSLSSAGMGAGGEAPVVFFLADGIPQPGGSARGEVRVPAVEGLPLRDAVRRLHSLGLRVRLQGGGTVEWTRPGAGAPLAPGDTVLIVGGAG
jgi:cell division protein FtsI (penicillin-binding protein 3)